jgi:4'-phosphopantetheinyl transferase
VWTCPLSRYDASAEALQLLLCSEERTRLERFAFERDRRRFALSHGLLRLILSGYVGEAPEKLLFDIAPRGKPSLVLRKRSGPDLRFSLSHSGGMALVAVACGREVGVDVEEIRADVHDLELAKRFFAPAEAQVIAEATGDFRRRLFYRYWTAKEAFLKGRGGGISDGLDRFEILWQTDGGLGRIRCIGSDAIDPRWLVQELKFEEALMGAVAVEGDGWQLQQCRLPSFSFS